ncbi:hypothetical protein [Halomonas sp. PR-M31]|uniref:hypothetical protein n=1 Tax=Halomonas sp. PR-M31 TaxID=1471202 RepID=UPI0034616D40
MNTRDPLLQPFSLRHLTLKNRIVSAAHEPAYSEEACPRRATGFTTKQRPGAAWP